MSKVLRACTSVLLGVGLCLSAADADSVYRTGGSTYGGQTVNAYTNAGAAEYRRTMRHGSGAIYNVAPKPTLRKSFSLSTLKIPSEVSYKKSLCKELPDRYVTHGNERVNVSDIVEEYAKLYNIDPILIEEVIRQESNFRPTATSRVGAQGLMQLMPGTAQMMGVSKPDDPKDNVMGGSRYLAQQLTRFGRLDYALAAYNAGPGAVDSYGGIPPYAETRNYVARIVNSYNNRVREEKKRKRNTSQDED